MRRGRDTEPLPSWVGEALRLVLLMLAEAARGTGRINPAAGPRKVSEGRGECVVRGSNRVVLLDDMLENTDIRDAPTGCFRLRGAQ